MNKETKQKLIKDFYDIVHIIGGIILGLAGWEAPILSITGLTAFGIFEWWQAKEVGDEGSHDFWGGVTGYILGIGIGLVLTLLGII